MNDMEEETHSYPTVAPTLPLDITIILANQLSHSPPSVAFPILTRLAIISHAFLPAAQMALYRNPLVLPLNWKKARILLTTLQTNPELASYVSDLSELSDRMRRLGIGCHPITGSENKMLDSEEGNHSWNWARKVLEAVVKAQGFGGSGRRLERVSLVGETGIEIEKCLRTLELRKDGKERDEGEDHRGLQWIQLDSPTRSALSHFGQAYSKRLFLGNYQILPTLVVKDLNLWTPEQIKSAETDLFIPKPKDENATPTFSLSVSSLELVNANLGLYDLVQCIPKPSLLRHLTRFYLSLVGYSSFPNDLLTAQDFLLLAKWLASYATSLEELYLIPAKYTKPYYNFNSYGRLHEGPSIPTEFFQLPFSKIRSLTFSSITSLTSEKVSFLIMNSPKLEMINFERSIWERWSSAESQALVACLVGDDGGFEERGLKVLNVGMLPIALGDGVPEFEEVEERTGTKVVWEGVRKYERGEDS